MEEDSYSLRQGGGGDYQARLGSDAPSEIDELGAHERVASSMDRLIAQSVGGKTIALEGKWGSGKSSVIRLLSKKCASRKTALHQYDAWIHAGDPLRRAFLTSLIDFLVEKGWLANEEIWKSQLATLAGKQRESRKISSPMLTTFGFLLAFSFLLIPGGLYCFSKAFDELVKRETVHIGWWPTFLFWFGIATFLLPVLISIVNVAYRWIRGLPRINYLAILLNKQTTIEQVSITDDGDQSTIEFQKVFGQVVASALGADAERKLILVIDNLDRIDGGDVSNVWALLQSFIDIPRFSGEPWHGRLWVIVPIANQTEESGVSQFASSFLDKVFQARFRLPPPIMMKWRPYLERLLREALPGITSEEVGKVSDLFSASLGVSRLPTPRELVLIANQLAIFHEQWRDKYEISIGAAYIFENVDIGFDKLVSGDIPTEKIQRIVGSDLKAAYACIYFNTGDEADALDLLQRPLAMELLAQLDVNQLAANMASHRSFAPVLTRVLSDRVDDSNLMPEKLFSEIVCVAQACNDKALLSLKSDPFSLSAASFSVLQGSLLGNSRLVIERNGVEVLLCDSFKGLIVTLLASHGVEAAAILARPLYLDLTAGFLHDIANDRKIRDFYIDNLVAILGEEEVVNGLVARGDKLIVGVDGTAFALLLDQLGSEADFLMPLLSPHGEKFGAENFLSEEINHGRFSEIDRWMVLWLEAVGVGAARKCFEAVLGVDESRYAEQVIEISGVFFDCVLKGAQASELTKKDDIQKSATAAFNSLAAGKEYSACASLFLAFVASISSELPQDVELFFKGLSPSTLLTAPAESPEFFSSLCRLLENEGLGGWLANRSTSLAIIRPLFFACFDGGNVPSIKSFVEQKSALEVIDFAMLLVEGQGDAANSFRDFAITTALVNLAIEPLYESFDGSQDKWRWVSRFFEVLKNDERVLELSSIVASDLIAIDSRGWLDSSRFYTWREWCAIEVSKRDPEFSLRTLGDLITAVAGSFRAGAKPGWQAKPISNLAGILKISVKNQLAKSEIEILINENVVRTKDYWILVGPLVESLASSQQYMFEIQKIMHWLVQVQDEFGLLWLSSTLEAPATRKLLTKKEFRADFHGRIRESMRQAVSDRPVAVALESLKNAVAKSARSFGRGVKKSSKRSGGSRL